MSSDEAFAADALFDAYRRCYFQGSARGRRAAAEEGLGLGAWPGRR